jgi:hypothetical protein
MTWRITPTMPENREDRPDLIRTWSPLFIL